MSATHSNIPIINMEIGTDALLDNIQACMVTTLKMKQTYETAIAQEESALAQDRRLLNSFQPIGKIPMDVLLIIFMFYIQDTLPENTKRRNPFNIVRLTHVCSRWRVVATETATLWTFIDLGWPAWTIALIPRSGLAPLNVVFSSYSPVEKYPTKSLTKHHSRRIASLKISAPHNIFTWLDIFIPLFLPSLRVLQLACAYGEASTPRFAGNLPTNLQYFRLMGNLKWKIESPPLLSHSTLETLSLRLNTPDSRLQMGDILRALDNVPLLKQLHLHTVFSTLWSTSLPSIVQLPYLTRLSIFGNVSNCAAFLEKLDIVSVAELKVYAYGSASDISSLAASMSEIIERSASFPAFPRYSIEYDWASIYLSAGNEDSLAADTGHFQQPRQHTPLEITINISHHQLPTSVGGITSRLNLTCVRQLPLDILRICRPIEDFMFLPSITVLRLCEESVTLAKDILKPVLSYHPDKTRYVQTFPNLERIEIVDMPEIRGRDLEDGLVERVPPDVPFEVCFRCCRTLDSAYLSSLARTIDYMYSNAVHTNQTAPGDLPGFASGPYSVNLHVQVVSDTSTTPAIPLWDVVWDAETEWVTKARESSITFRSLLIW